MNKPLQHTSISDSLRMRILKVKTLIPKGFDYTPVYIYEFGKQTDEELNKIRMVWNLRATDEKITRNLEIIAENLKQL
jgi:hypothetical protein